MPKTVTTGKRLRSRNPIAAFDKGGGLVGTSGRQPILFSAGGPPQNRAQRYGCQAGEDREFLLNIAAQLVNLLTHASIDFLELSLHHPKRRIVSAAELLHLSRKPLTDSRIGVVLVALPALEHGLAHAIETGPITFEIAPKRPIQEPL